MENVSKSVASSFVARKQHVPDVLNFIFVLFTWYSSRNNETAAKRGCTCQFWEGCIALWCKIRCFMGQLYGTQY